MSLPEVVNTPEAPDVGRSVNEYFTGKLRDAMDNLTPQMLLKPEQVLVEELDPTPLDYDIRRQFWMAVDIAKKTEKKHVPTVRVWEDVCHPSYFFDHVLTNPLRVAWISRPIVDYVTFYEAINRAALQKIFDYVRNHNINEKTLSHFVKIAEMSANRAYGGVTQKMQIQSKNLNVDITAKQGELPQAPDTQQITSRIEHLQGKLLSEPRDITPKDE